MSSKRSPLQQLFDLNWTTIKAIIKRDLRAYFMNPSGYVFLTLFILLSAAAAFWSEDFFANNLANLDQLNQYFPYLLLFFIPALTMNVWADERRQGTDELLLTLPATDLEVTLGKYFSLLGVYTASLVLSLSHVLVLSWLGNPDIGLMFGNYVGYWLIGASLLAVGMLASLLTRNVTVAFVLGALFVATLVFLDSPKLAFSESFSDWLSPLGVFPHFNDFSRGVISLTGLLYFISIAVVALYLNVVILGKRHWRAELETSAMRVHQAVRAVALLVAAVSLNAVVAHAAMRLDVTSEGLHSLSEKTKQILSDLPAERPVFIQAFVSKHVPRELVETRANLLGFLKEMDAVAGERAHVIIHETEQYSQDARDARDKFGINPRSMLPSDAARAQPVPVYMGVAFTCGSREDVIPFFERGLPVEYTLTRSISSVAQTDRKKIGVLTTDLKLFGGFDFQSFRSSPPWPIVDELKRQYEIVQVNAEEPITQELDAMVVALPSSLPQPQMDNLEKWVKAGHPTLLLVDPLPTFDVARSPTLPRDAGGNPFNRNQQQPKDPKGNIRQFFANLGVNWNSTEVFWDRYNPHPDLAHLPPEIVFIGRGSDSPEPFNESFAATSGLQEMALLYPGVLRKSPTSAVEFTPLITSGPHSGMLGWHSLVQSSFFGMQINRNPRRVPDAQTYVPAAYVRGVVDTTSASDGASINIMVIADVDFISQQFFQIRDMGVESLNFDNIPFFLNCIDVLAGDSSFIDLRKKRVKHRTLATVEEQTSEYYDKRLAEEKVAEDDAREEMAKAQRNLNEKVQKLRERDDLDEQTKQIMAQNLQEAENRRFEVKRTNIESERDAKIARSKENMELKIRSIQSRIKTLAVALPPTPVLLFGVFIYIRRRRREQESVNTARLLRSK